MRESVWRSARRGVSSKHELAAEEKDAEIAPETARLGEEDAGLGEGLEAALGLAGAGLASLTRRLCLAAFAFACVRVLNWIFVGLGCVLCGPRADGAY